MFRIAISATRSSAHRTVPAAVSRHFHHSPVSRKTVTEKVSEVAQNVNLKVGKGLASAIETGENATQAAKETIGTKAEQTKERASEAGDTAAHKANKAVDGAREAKRDFEKEVRK